MPTIETSAGPLAYDVTDLSPNWREPQETILFHHGVGIDMDIWSDWLPVLATEFRCVRFDMRGCGRSSIPQTDQQWTMDAMMADLLAVADAAEADRFHLIGESIGGTISLYTAINAPDRILSVTALSTGHRGNYIQQVGGWREMVEKDGFAVWTEKMMEHRFYPGAVDEDIYDWFAETQADSSPETTLALGEMLMAQDLSGELEKINCPVLLIHPDSSPFLPVTISAEIHSLLPNSEMMVIPHAKHAIACSHATEGSIAFLDFLSERVV
ncbi:MAG: alpha/beta hydrolase [Pseudomonadota bacterium]|nr:alpha/beta hydrolase [Pseudomonadota bacterium]